MDKQLMHELAEGLRRCRVCGAEYIGLGALCNTHALELIAKQKAENIELERKMLEHVAKQRAERRARRRVEWAEAV